MALHKRSAPRPSDPLDIPLRPLTIRSLMPRGATGAAADAVTRIRAEFIEMRGFSPTLAQAARLFYLSQDECARVLRLLATEGFISQMADGRYRLINGQ
jgi:hypothetical protein